MPTILVTMSGTVRFRWCVMAVPTVLFYVLAARYRPDNYARSSARPVGAGVMNPDRKIY